MPKELLLIRHGQTQANVEKRVYGEEDLDLTPTGVEEATALGLHLKELGITPDIIFASSLLRAQRTAQIVQSFVGGEINTREGLKEMNFGKYQGAGREVLQDIEYGYHIEKMREGKAETVEDLENRIAEFLRELASADGRTIVIVAHGMTLSVMSQMLMQMERNFANIQALKNADYNYFLFEQDENGGILIVDKKLNCFRGPLIFEK